MRAHVLLNLSNELGKATKFEACRGHHERLAITLCQQPYRLLDCAHMFLLNVVTYFK